MATKTTRLDISEAERAISAATPQSAARSCEQAVQYMAEARTALGGDSLDPNQALAHLDNAIACLQTLSRRGKASEQHPEGTVAVLENSATRRSA
ncbi:MAG: hypothetical protein AAGF48_08700 [Pseudomonadota bacterium]